MIGLVGLLLLITAGPQPGLSAHSSHELSAKSNQEAIEITANGVASKAVGVLSLIRRTGSQDSVPSFAGYSALASAASGKEANDDESAGDVHDEAAGAAPDTKEANVDEAAGDVHDKAADGDLVTPASVDDVEAAADGQLDKVSLCGQTCNSVIEGGAPCDSFYGSGCRGDPPPGFTTLSELYDICPIACGPKPDHSTGSSVWLWVLLIIFFLPLAVIGVIAAFLKCFFPKTYDMYKARAQQVLKSCEGRWNAWKYGTPYEYEEWDDEESDWDEEEEEELADEDEEDAGASQSYADDAGVSQSYADNDGSSQSMSYDDGSATAVMDQTMMPSGTTMMASAATMMPNATTMMGTMMGSSATMMMGSSATMVQEPTMMMQTMMPTMGSSATMVQEPTMMMGSSATMMMDDQPTMQNFGSTDTL